MVKVWEDLLEVLDSTLNGDKKFLLARAKVNGDKKFMYIKTNLMSDIKRKQPFIKQ